MKIEPVKLNDIIYENWKDSLGDGYIAVENKVSIQIIYGQNKFKKLIND